MDNINLVKPPRSACSAQTPCNRKSTCVAVLESRRITSMRSPPTLRSKVAAISVNIASAYSLLRIGSTIARPKSATKIIPSSLPTKISLVSLHLVYHLYSKYSIASSAPLFSSTIVYLITAPNTASHPRGLDRRDTQPFNEAVLFSILMASGCSWTSRGRPL